VSASPLHNADLSDSITQGWGAFKMPILKVWDGSLSSLYSEGSEGVGQNLRGRVYDLGIGTPGPTAHSLKTGTVLVGFNFKTLEFFACGATCVGSRPLLP
jgi:hypothetical protein